MRGGESRGTYPTRRRTALREAGCELLGLLTAWALEEFGFQRIVLIVDVDNTASSRVAARAGYTREGVMRSRSIKAGTPRR